MRAREAMVAREDGVRRDGTSRGGHSCEVAASSRGERESYKLGEKSLIDGVNGFFSRDCTLVVFLDGAFVSSAHGEEFGAEFAERPAVRFRHLAREETGEELETALWVVFLGIDDATAVQSDVNEIHAHDDGPDLFRRGVLSDDDVGQMFHRGSSTGNN